MLKQTPIPFTDPTTSGDRIGEENPVYHLRVSAPSAGSAFYGSDRTELA